MAATGPWPTAAAYTASATGVGYFAINDGGNVEVRPQGADSTPIDLYELVGQLREAGLSLPLLVRFPDILQDRVRKLTGAFDANIEAPRIPEPLYRAVSDQGQPAGSGGGEHHRHRERLHRPGGRLQAGTHGGAGAGPEGRHHRLQRLQGPRVHQAGADGAEARAQRVHRDREGIRGAAGDRGGRQRRRAAPGRPARAAVLAGFVEVGRHRWREGQVRPFRRPAAVGGRALPPGRSRPRRAPAAFPHGLADRQPGRLPARLQGSHPLLRRAARARPAGGSHRRWRRPRRRLRRHPFAQRQLDQLRHR